MKDERIYFRERDLQIDLIKAIKNLYGDDVWIFKTNDQCRVGIPDLIICFYGHFVAIELKRQPRKAMRVDDPVERDEVAEYKDLTKLQKYNLMLINRSGGSAFPGRYFNEIMMRLAKIHETVNKIY